MKIKKKPNKGTLIAIAISLFFITSLILWSGFKKEPVPIQKPLEAISLDSKIPAESTSQIFFASNGKNSVYKIKKGDRWSVIWNGEEGKEYDFVSNPVFSADGSNLAYSAELDGQAYVVINNTQEIYAYMRATNLVFSADGQTIAFVAAQSSSAYVIISSSVTTPTTTIPTTTESPVYEQIGTIDTEDGSTAIIISPDGQEIVYAIVEDDKIYLVIDGVESTTGYDTISDFVLNDDGTYSYTATDGDIIVEIVNGTVVSTTDTTTTDTTTNPTTTPDDSTTQIDPEDYEDYKYKISTDQDIDLGDTRTDGGCTGDCNF